MDANRNAIKLQLAQNFRNGCIAQAHNSFALAPQRRSGDVWSFMNLRRKCCPALSVASQSKIYIEKIKV